MRFYKITIRDPDGNLITRPSSVPGVEATYTSYDGQNSLPGALQIELDIPLSSYATPMKGAGIRIWGISLGEIASAADMNPKYVGNDLKVFTIAIEAGMQAGLPLANPEQAGLIMEGSIFQAFGNWLGTEQTLDIILGPDLGTNANPKNIAFNWTKGQRLDAAISQTLDTAFPGKLQNINISPDLVFNADQPGFYSTLEQFAVYVKQASMSIIGSADYAGVDIFLQNGAFYVTDGTTQQKPKEIAFQDLIGQPTWIGPPLQIQFKTVMRGDLAIGDYVRLPPSIVTTTGTDTAALVNLNVAFAGTFRITEMRHVGSFRQADAASWVTTFNASPEPDRLVPRS